MSCYADQSAFSHLPAAPEGCHWRELVVYSSQEAYDRALRTCTKEGIVGKGFTLFDGHIECDPNLDSKIAKDFGPEAFWVAY